MLHFIKYLIVWISQNLSIPFWMVGHVHLTINVYQDIHELLASLGMNILVAIGFWISYKENKHRNKMNKIKEKTCYHCHIVKNTSEMQEIGVWLCNECLEKSKTLVKKEVYKDLRKSKFKTE